MEEKWKCIIKSSDDEDVQADYSNDLIQLHILQDAFEAAAVKEFGTSVKEFSREPLSAIT